ncbi:MAG: hypothetical protein HY062_08820 [Bacteroidetes bacterium]|nr:hypothetical protein [Bacteroidota bacterium]
MILSLLKGTPMVAQATTWLKFDPCFGASTLSGDSTYQLTPTDSIHITGCRFYISGIELLDRTGSLWKDPATAHLMNAFNEKTLSVLIPENIPYNRIKFNLGIDSTTNVSGALGGDLDPTKGMYWTWQSGYINFKLEGNSNRCKTRHNEFQFHLGGYQHPFNNLQTVFIEALPKQQVHIQIDIHQLINQIDLSQQHHIMSPGQEAMDFTEKIIHSLKIQK